MNLIFEDNHPRGSFRDEFKVFFSYFSFNEPPLYRSIINEDHLRSRVILYNNHTFIGEDPRPFVLKGKRYILSQRFVNTMKDVQNYVVNVDTGEAKQYIVDEPDFFYGKNWTPFVYQEKLWIIHRFDPFTLLCDGKVVMQLETNLPVEPGGKFTCHRGGSNGLEVEPGVIFGIGHRTVHGTPDNTIHKPYAWLIDFNSMELYLYDIPDFQAKSKIVDPTSMWMESDKIYVSTYEGDDIWNREHKQYYIRIYTIDYKNLKKTIDEVGQKFKLSYANNI